MSGRCKRVSVSASIYNSTYEAKLLKLAQLDPVHLTSAKSRSVRGKATLSLNLPSERQSHSGESQRSTEGQSCMVYCSFSEGQGHSGGKLYNMSPINVCRLITLPTCTLCLTCRCRHLALHGLGVSRHPSIDNHRETLIRRDHIGFYTCQIYLIAYHMHRQIFRWVRDKRGYPFA